MGHIIQNLDCWTCGHHNGKIRGEREECGYCPECQKDWKGVSSPIFHAATIAALILSGFSCAIFSAAFLLHIKEPGFLMKTLAEPHLDIPWTFLPGLRRTTCYLFLGYIFSSILFCWNMVRFVTGLARKGDIPSIGVSILATMISLGYWAHVGASEEEEFLIVLPVTLSLVQILHTLYFVSVNGWSKSRLWRSQFWRPRSLEKRPDDLDWNLQITQDCEKGKEKGVDVVETTSQG